VAANLETNIAAFRWYSVPSFLLAVGVACAPWALLLRVEGWQGVGMDAQEGRRFLRALAVAVLLQAPLFVLTKDWGRWLAIDFTLLTIWYIAVRCRQAMTHGAIVGRRDLMLQILILILYLISMIPWRISHCCLVGVMPSPLLVR
jgi:hypothetical protein